MFSIFTIALAIACGEKPANDSFTALADASDLKVEQIDITTAKLTWSDNAEGEKVTEYSFVERMTATSSNHLK